MRLLRTDVRVNRWRARQIGLRRGSVLILKRDVLIEIDGVLDGLHLRFGRVIRIRPRGTHAVLQVRWRQYSGTAYSTRRARGGPPRPETAAAH